MDGQHVYVPEGKSLLLRYKGPLVFTWQKYAEPGHSPKEGEIGVLERCPARAATSIVPSGGNATMVNDVVVHPARSPMLTSKLGEDLPGGQFLVDGDIGQTQVQGHPAPHLRPRPLPHQSLRLRGQDRQDRKIDAGNRQIKHPAGCTFRPATWAW